MKLKTIYFPIIFGTGLVIFTNTNTPDTIYSTGLSNTSAGPTELQSILQIVFGIIGSIAVLIILIAGFKFISSSGNPESIAKARETIIYAIIGLVVAMLAEVIVSFVLFSVGGS